jgi:hypothetical protein
MPFEALDDDDEVVKCLAQMRGMLRHLSSADVLANGKVEKQLKLLLASAWIKGHEDTRACVMDKRFNRRELDLLALQKGIPKFWIETKCDFLEKGNDARSSARQALKQVRSTRSDLGQSTWHEDGLYRKHGEALQSFRREIKNCPTYVVHFLNSVPNNENSRYPPLVMLKYGLNRQMISPEQLGWYYMEQGRSGAERFKGLPLSDSHPYLHALVVKLPAETDRDIYLPSEKLGTRGAGPNAE